MVLEPPCSEPASFSQTLSCLPSRFVMLRLPSGASLITSKINHLQSEAARRPLPETCFLNDFCELYSDVLPFPLQILCSPHSEKLQRFNLIQGQWAHPLPWLRHPEELAFMDVQSLSNYLLQVPHPKALSKGWRVCCKKHRQTSLRLLSSTDRHPGHASGAGRSHRHSTGLGGWLLVLGLGWKAIHHLHDPQPLQLQRQQIQTLFENKLNALESSRSWLNHSRRICAYSSRN